jgi:hypothetical protein
MAEVTKQSTASSQSSTNTTSTDAAATVPPLTSHLYAFFNARGAGSFQSFHDAGLAETWVKLGLDGARAGVTIQYTGPFNASDPKPFLVALWNDAGFRGALAVPHLGPGLERLPPVEDVICEQLNATVTSMAFFDRLQGASPDLPVGATGAVRKLVPDTAGGVSYDDRLRQIFVTEDCDPPGISDLFTRDDQKELLFRMFNTIVTGGGICQPEVREGVTTSHCRSRIHETSIAGQMGTLL